MRIQILPLPSVVVGDDVEEPFAIVVDQAPRFDELAPKDHEAWQAFAAACGARALLTVPYAVEVVDRYAEPSPSPAEVDMQRRKAMEDRAKYEAALKQLQEEHGSEPHP